jgi:hypothetical protein
MYLAAGSGWGRTHEPNPILVEFRSTLRNYQNKSLCLSHYVEYVTHGTVYGWSPEHTDHARRVLTRLARLQTEVTL